MRIVDNVAAMRVLTNLGRTDRAIGRSTVRLSSGFRINTAGDDPAGFSISLKLRRQVASMEMADRNTLDGTSLLETADAALQDIHNMIQRMRELAVAASNDTNTDEDRANIQEEIYGLLDEINDITRKVEFNNIRLLDGEASNLHIQVGGREGMTIPVSIPSFTTWSLGMTSDRWHRGLTSDDVDWLDPNLDLSTYDTWHLNVSTWGAAQQAISMLDDALARVSLNRAEIGATINRFEYTSTSLRAATEATARSLSRIMDTDMAFEMMQLSKHNILSQAGMSILAQVNARPQQVLQLLG